MEYYSGIFEEKNSRSVWKSIKLLTGTSKSQLAVTNMKIGDSLTDDKQNIVEQLNNYFVGVLLPDIPFDISKLATFIDSKEERSVHFSIPLITSQEVEAILGKLNPNNQPVLIK